MERDSAGRRFKRLLRYNSKARQDAQATIAKMPGGWYGGMVGGAVKGEIVTGKTKDLVEQQIDRHYDAAIARRVLPQRAD